MGNCSAFHLISVPSRHAINFNDAPSAIESSKNNNLLSSLSSSCSWRQSLWSTGLIKYGLGKHLLKHFSRCQQRGLSEAGGAPEEAVNLKRGSSERERGSGSLLFFVGIGWESRIFRKLGDLKCSMNAIKKTVE